MRIILLAFLVSSFAFPEDLHNVTVRFRPSHTKKCLNTLDKSNAWGVGIVQWSCSDQAHQRFHLTKNEDGYFFIQSTGSKLCFGVPYAMYGHNGVTLLQVGCDPYENKSNEFSIQKEETGLYTIRPRRAPETCLGIVNSSKDMFTAVVQETCTECPSQLFQLEIQ